MTFKFLLVVLIGVLVCTTTARKLVGSIGSFNDEKNFFHHPSLGGGGLGGGGLGGGGGGLGGGAGGGIGGSGFP